MVFTLLREANWRGAFLQQNHDIIIRPFPSPLFTVSQCFKSIVFAFIHDPLSVCEQYAIYIYMYESPSLFPKTTVFIFFLSSPLSISTMPH